MRVRNGATVTLVCTVDFVTDPQGPNVLWDGPSAGISYSGRLLHTDMAYKYDLSIDNTADEESTKISLTIKNMNLKDEGDYECQNFAASPLQKRKVTIYVSSRYTLCSG